MVFQTLNQSISFHSSPESFISSRLQDLALSDPDLLPSAAGQNKIVVASILNRKVHIVSSYQVCKDILEASSSPSRTSLTPPTIIPGAGSLPDGNARQHALNADTIVAGPAYHQLMSDFFPPPNMLLQDGPTHGTHKQAWTDQLSTFPPDISPRIRQIAEKHISLLLHPAAGDSDGKIDLYNKLKPLAWEVVLGIFLDISPSSSPKEFSQVESLQETLLRGQFSLFPVSINARLWQSARSKGIKARKELQLQLKKIVDSQEASCPFLKQGKVSKDDAACHALLFTSSIAVKALASLLTAFILNLFLWRDHGHDYLGDGGDSGHARQTSATSLAELIRSQGDTGIRDRMLQSILLETERLSPPVVGVMRRVQRDVILQPNAQSHRQPHPQAATKATGNGKDTIDERHDPPVPPGSSAHPVPAGHDIWLYLSGASRDPTIFGDDADVFRFDRYMSSSSSSSSSSAPDNSSLNTITPPPGRLERSSDTTPPSLAFSAGPKSCLGTDLVRQIVLTVGEVLIESRMEMEGEVGDRGVRGWLGWEGGVGAEWVAKGMKQLPVQRPRGKVRVEVKGK